MYKRIFSVRVKDKGNVTDTYVQNCCKNDFEYMIVFIKLIDFFKIALLDENNKCSYECVKSIKNLIEECFADNHDELCKYMTYFKKFCELLELPNLDDLGNEDIETDFIEVL